MKKIVIVNGVISGLIAAGWLIGLTIVGGEHLESGMIYGYASMLLAFSLIFVGIKNYRDRYLDGVISFGKAFKTGILIALIASTFYVLTWQVCYFFFMPDFGEIYGAYVVEQLKKSGASQIQIDAKIKEMTEFARMYKNPFFNAMLTYCEILPVGLVISLVAAAILKRKPKPSMQ